MIAYELDAWSRELISDFSSKECLFGGAKLTKNADLNKYLYSGYGIGFDSHLEFSLPADSIGKNVIIFRVDISSSVHIDNNGKNVLIFGM